MRSGAGAVEIRKFFVIINIALQREEKLPPDLEHQLAFLAFGICSRMASEIHIFITNVTRQTDMKTLNYRPSCQLDFMYSQIHADATAPSDRKWDKHFPGAWRGELAISVKLVRVWESNRVVQCCVHLRRYNTLKVAG